MVVAWVSDSHYQEFFSATQILREINFCYSEAQKIAVLTIWAALNFEFMETFDIFKSEIFPIIKIQSLQNC